MTTINTRLAWRGEHLFAGEIWIGRVWMDTRTDARTKRPWHGTLQTGYEGVEVGYFATPELARTALEQAARRALEGM
jgi:hypothetical protein